MNFRIIFSNFILGGGLDATQVTEGQLADFNMWNYTLSAEQINVTTCDSVGNVASWNTLSKMGTSENSVKAFPGCN